MCPIQGILIVMELSTWEEATEFIYLPGWKLGAAYSQALPSAFPILWTWFNFPKGKHHPPI